MTATNMFSNFGGFRWSSKAGQARLRLGPGQWLKLEPEPEQKLE